jgi:hypothetical protein
MRERGKYQVQCMKSRSSTGVGNKIDLEYNIETMRITDPGLDANETGFGPPKASIMDQIRGDTKTLPRPEARPGAGLDIPTVSAEVQSSKLKSMLAGLKSKSD